MNQDNTRHIRLKINVNEAEESLIRRTCAKAGKTVSALGRELLLKASAPAHRRPRNCWREGPRSGPVKAPMFPSRRVGAVRPMRL